MLVTFRVWKPNSHAFGLKFGLNHLATDFEQVLEISPLLGDSVLSLLTALPPDVLETP